MLYPNLRSLRNFFTDPWSAPRIEVLEDAGVRHVQLNGFNLSPRIEFGIRIQWLRAIRILFDEYVRHHGRPDVIHAHCALYAGVAAARISAEENIPFVVTEHSTGYSRKIFTKSQLSWAGSTFEKSSACIAVSNSFMHLLQDGLGFGHNWQVIPNIVERRFYESGIKISNSQDSVRLLHVALLNPIKRQELLVEAIYICKQAGRSDIKLTIAGSGPKHATLKKRISGLAVENQISLIGSVKRNDMPELMVSHDGFVLCSDYETFGVVVAEALASGLSSISTDCGGPRDIIGAGDGIIVPRGDAAAIARAMMNLSKIQGDAEIRNNRRQRAARRFGEDAVCAELIEVYSAATAATESR